MKNQSDPDPSLVREAGELPSRHVVDRAVEIAQYSPCRSKRGAVIFVRATGGIVAHGYNFKPRGFDCDGSAACKSTCRGEAVHAEQSALMLAGVGQAAGRDLLHVKVVDGVLVASGGPSCIQCSKLAMAAGIAGVWLYHDEGWRRYEMTEFHRLSLESAAHGRAPAIPPAGFVDGVLYCYGGCGRRYEDFPLDVILPNAMWNRIAVGYPFKAPHPDDEREGRGGVLCASCIVERLAKLPDVTVAFLSTDESANPNAPAIPRARP